MQADDLPQASYRHYLHGDNKETKIWTKNLLTRGPSFNEPCVLGVLLIIACSRQPAWCCDV